LFVVTKFYENMLRMKMQLEKTYFDLAATSKTNCLIICDGGTMDIKARKCTLLHFLTRVTAAREIRQVCHMSKSCRPTAFCVCLFMVS